MTEQPTTIFVPTTLGRSDKHISSYETIELPLNVNNLWKKNLFAIMFLIITIATSSAFWLKKTKFENITDPFKEEYYWDIFTNGIHIFIFIAVPLLLLTLIIRNAPKMISRAAVLTLSSEGIIAKTGKIDIKWRDVVRAEFTRDAEHDTIDVKLDYIAGQSSAPGGSPHASFFHLPLGGFDRAPIILAFVIAELVERNGGEVTARPI